MKRVNMIAAIDEPKNIWDVIVIGGGATGLGAAVESASRGHRTLLLESHDFAKGTSSRSTKLIHGGVRYLRQGQVGMVRQSLRERQRLFRNATHLVHPLEFVMPTYSWGKRELYYVGLRLYDLLAGNFWSGRARWLTSLEVRNDLPALQDAGLKGGVKYVDGQFDDSRLAISLARTAVNHDAVVVNYMKVVRLQCQAGKIRSVVARDGLSGREFTLSGRAVINATGVFADELLDLEVDSTANHNNNAIDTNRPTVRPSQGSHVVLDADFLPGAKALMIPETDDGRVLFAIPWHGKVLLGTTDTEVKSISVEPRPLSSEIDYLLDYGSRYLRRAPSQSDIRSCFSGLRPLVAKMSATAATSRLSREHEIYVGPTGMITVIGGKWTTYRHMGEELINHAESIGSLPRRKSITSELSLHGNWQVGSQNLNHLMSVETEHLNVYGTDSLALASLSCENVSPRDCSRTPDMSDDQLHKRLPYLVREVIWNARYEMAMTVEDVLARRTRALFLDAQAATEAAPRVAALLRAELSQTADWEKAQVLEFQSLAAGYYALNSKASFPSNNT